MSVTVEIPEHVLPETARELLRLIGWQATLTLVQTMPGARIYASRMQGRVNGGRYEAICDLLGKEAAQKLYRHFKGGLLEIPNCKGAMQAARDSWLRQSYDAGAGIEALCLQSGLSRRRIWDILKTPDIDKAGTGVLQIALFK